MDLNNCANIWRCLVYSNLQFCGVEMKQQDYDDDVVDAAAAVVVVVVRFVVVAVDVVNVDVDQDAADDQS